MRKSVAFLIIISVCVGLILFYFQSNRRGQMTLMAKFTFGKEGKDLGELGRGLTAFTANNKYLYVADSGNNRIQVLQINSDGNLSPQSVFGKEGNRLGEFGNYLTALKAVGNYLYVSDTGNARIQVLEIAY